MEDLSLGFDKHDDTVQIIKTLTSSIWPLALLLCLSACAPMGRPIGGGGGGSDPFAGGSRPTPQDIELRVRNLNFNDARLYAVSGGSRRRLGQVSALSDDPVGVYGPPSNRNRSRDRPEMLDKGIHGRPW
jgi:hypothetical protein